MRVIVRKERPHPGAQLRFTDPYGHRFTAFATDARKGQLADLELRHRRRVRCEDRIRCAKDTGLRNLPLKGSPTTSCDARSWPYHQTKGRATTSATRRVEASRSRRPVASAAAL